MFRGAELPRLMSGIVMLAVVYLLFVRFRDADTWRWLAKAGGTPAETAKAPPSQTQKPAAPLPAATGPTDEDPDQAETAHEEFQALTDGTLALGPEEMEPYDRLVVWVKNQSYARLYARAKKGLRYTDLYDGAERHRGELVALNVEVRLASDEGKNRDGVHLYEAWAVTDQSLGRLYDLVVVDFPTGIPLGQFIQEKAKFVGYFLKLQGYESGSAKPGQAPEKAPLLIGRLLWEHVAAPPVDNTSTQHWAWGLSLLALVGLLLGLGWVASKWLGRKPAARSMVADAASGEVIPIETWLERSCFDAEDDKSRPQKEDDFLHGEVRNDGRSGQAARPLLDRLDGEAGEGR
jgi:hypothetical protein